MTKWVSESDIIITTALIPGRPAPKLISAAMLSTMKPGSGGWWWVGESGGGEGREVWGDVAWCRGGECGVMRCDAG